MQNAISDFPGPSMKTVGFSPRPVLRVEAKQLLPDGYAHCTAPREV